MCVIALNPEGTGKLYITDESLADGEVERQAIAEQRAAQLERELGNSSLDENGPANGKRWPRHWQQLPLAFAHFARCLRLGSD